MTATNSAALLKLSRDEIIDGVTTVALTGVALSGLRRAYGGWTFLVVGVIAALVGFAVAHVIHRLRLPALLGVAISLVILLVIGTPLSIRDETIAGFIPKPAVFFEFVDGVIGGWRRLLTTTAPSGALGNVLAVVVVCGFLAGLGSTLLSRRPKRLASLLALPGAVLVVSVLFGDRRPFSIVIQGAILGIVAIAWLSLRKGRERKQVIHSAGRNRLISGAVMLGLMGGAGFAFGPDLPFAAANPRYVLRDRIDPPFDPRQFGSPLNGFQRYLIGDLKDKTMFTITGLPAATESLVPIAVMDDYDGVVWRVSPKSGTQGGRFRRVGESAPITVTGEPLDLEITIKDLPGFWMPTMGAVTGVEWTTGGTREKTARELFRLSTITSTGIVPQQGGWEPGDSYVLHAVVPKLTLADLATGERDANSLTDITPAVPEPLKTSASATTKGKSVQFDQVRELEKYFKAGYYASGDKEAEQANAPGHSYARLLKFIENDQPIGNAEQYAAAMAVMARSLDIPARVVMGFKVPPGVTDVKGSNVHAWVEIGFKEGWVTVDPTSDKKEKPKNPNKRPKPFFESQNVPPPPIVPPEPDVNARQTDDDRKVKPPEDEEIVAPDKPLSKWVVAAAITGAIPLVGLVGFGFVVALLKRRRRKRRRHSAVVANRFAGGWAEYVDSARDIGLPVPPKATRREEALMIGADESVELAVAADAAVFGWQDHEDSAVAEFWQRVTDGRRGLYSQLSPPARLRAVFSTTSLRSHA